MNAMKTTRRLALLAAAIMCAASTTPARASLPAGISGPWYNPEQSGHGLTVELLPDDRALVFWHVFDTAGMPMTLYVEARIEGDAVDGIAYAPSGMRFGSFDTNHLALPVWGSVRLEFSDCNHATLSWHASSEAFGSGSMAIERLASIRGLACSDLAPSELPVGPYHAEITSAGARPDSTADGFVDREGRLWGIERMFSGGTPVELPAINYTGQGVYVPFVFHTEAPTGDDLQASGWLGQAWWTQVPVNTVAHAATAGHWQVVGDVVGEFDGHPEGVRASVESQLWRNGARSGVEVVAPLSFSQLAGAYHIPLHVQFHDHVATLEIEPNGDLCLDTEGQDDCEYQGSAWLRDGDIGLFDFTLEPAADIVPSSTINGRGWLQAEADGRVLLMIGDNGVTAFGLIGR